MICLPFPLHAQSFRSSLAGNFLFKNLYKLSCITATAAQLIINTKILLLISGKFKRRITYRTGTIIPIQAFLFSFDMVFNLKLLST